MNEPEHTGPVTSAEVAALAERAGAAGQHAAASVLFTTAAAMESGWTADVARAVAPTVVAHLARIAAIDRRN